MFSNINIIIHESSYKYIESVVKSIIECISITSGIIPIVTICPCIKEDTYADNSLIFIIGDSFLDIKKKTNCFYVFINFSLLFRFRPYKFLFNNSRSWINNKKMLFEERIKSFDMIIDFYLPQTKLLEKNYGSNLYIENFLPSILPSHNNLEINNFKKWDVCFVGTLSRRRIRVEQELLKAGFLVSPYETDDIDNIIINSRVVINIHYVSCDTLEFPRVVHAFARNTCLVTETCYKMEEFFPSNTYVSADYKNVVRVITNLLNDNAKRISIANNALQYINEVYQNNVIEKWKHIFEVITNHNR